jgi:hypothetical protein
MVYYRYKKALGKVFVKNIDGDGNFEKKRFIKLGKKSSKATKF